MLCRSPNPQPQWLLGLAPRRCRRHCLGPNRRRPAHRQLDAICEGLGLVRHPCGLACSRSGLDRSVRSSGDQACKGGGQKETGVRTLPCNPGQRK